MSSDNQEHYETLPELLSDLSKMVQNNPRQLQCSGIRWTATIDCGGDYHNLYFSTSSSNHHKPDKINHTYEDLDSLYTELEYIQEFLSTQEIGNFDLTYEIISNGGKPFLRVYLLGTPETSCSKKEDQTSGLFRLLPEIHEVRGMLLLASMIPVVMIPTMYIADKLIR